ncbi:MAG: CoA-binding protein [Salibacteraceae bacterium]
MKTEAVNKPTAIIGASPNPARYSFLATNMLRDYNHPVYPLGIRKGEIDGVEIITQWPDQIQNLDTITLYIGPQNQPEHYDYLIGLKPKRIVFNPGTENPELKKKAEVAGIETIEACTLVMLRTSQF